MEMAWLAVSPSWCNNFSVSAFKCGSNRARTVASFAMSNPFYRTNGIVAQTGHIFKLLSCPRRLPVVDSIIEDLDADRFEKFYLPDGQKTQNAAVVLLLSLEING